MVPEWTLLGDGRKFSVTSGAQSMDDTFMSHASCSTLCFLSISGGVWGCGCDSENVQCSQAVLGRTSIYVILEGLDLVS